MLNVDRPTGTGSDRRPHDHPAAPVSMAVPAVAAGGQSRGPAFREFVVLIAALMALTALAIDAMLPALPQIGRDLAVANANHRQLVVTAFLLGLGVGQIFLGTISDRFGRKPVLVAGLLLYVPFSLLSAVSGSFEMLLAMRALSGVGAAASRVLAVSIVRDRFSGRRMARVMSLAFIVFLAIPVVAPSLGQLILGVAPWRWIFGVLALSGLLVLAAVLLRLPETLPPERRRSIDLRHVLDAWRTVLTTRTTIFYTLALTLLTGALFGMINSLQQIFYDVFDEPELFPIMFAVPAGAMAVASLLNASLVERLGTRRLSHAGLLGFIGFGAVHGAVALAGLETMWSFVVLQAATMFCFALCASNFGAMSMEPVGHIAGTASSVQGTLSTIGAALIGAAIGASFNYTVVPFVGSLTACGIAALGAVLAAERGRLFRPHEEEAPGPVVLRARARG